MKKTQTSVSKDMEGVRCGLQNDVDSLEKSLVVP